MATVGDCLHGQRGEYELKAFLGEGLTARVYRAHASRLEQDVAVKVLKPGCNQEVIERFVQEHQLLSEVTSALSCWEDDSGLKPAQPPVVYEFWSPAVPLGVVSRSASDPDPSPRETFMVMDLIPGRKIEELLAENGPFNEPEGLIIGVQLIGLFQVLHEHVERTYTDFKFENLWWQSDGQRLWVTDWNVLSEKKKLDGIPRDLERGIRALVTILTGQPLPPGRLLSQHPGWKALSIGAQQALNLWLHPVPERRPGSASELRQQMLALLNAWQGGVQRLLDRAEDMLSAVEELWQETEGDPAGRERLVRARWQAATSLGVLRARQMREQAPTAWPTLWVLRLDALWERATGHVATVQQLKESALRMIEAGSAGPACGLLEQALLESPDELALHRLLAVARSINSSPARGKPLPSVLSAALRRLCDEKDLDADDAGLSSLLNETGDSLLSCEVKGRRKWLQALGETNLPKNAWTAASDAKRLFDQLDVPYRRAVIASLDVNFQERLADLAHKAQQNENACIARQFASEIRKELDLHKAVDVIVQQLPCYAEEALVIDASLDLAERCLDRRQPDLARQVYSVGLRAARHSHFEWPSDPALAEQWLPLFRAGWHTAGALVQLKNSPLEDLTYQALTEAAREVTEALNCPNLSDKPRYQSLKEALINAIDAAQRAVPPPDDTFQVAQSRLVDLHEVLRSGIRRSMQDRVRSTLAEAWKDNKSVVQLEIEQVTGMPEGLLAFVEKLFPRNARNGDSRTDQKISSEDEAHLVLVHALGLPENIRLLETLAAKKVQDKPKFAKELRQLAERLSPQSVSSQSGVDEPSANAGPSSPKGSASDAAAGGQACGPAHLRNLLQSSDPNNWFRALRSADTGNPLPTDIEVLLSNRKKDLLGKWLQESPTVATLRQNLCVLTSAHSHMQDLHEQYRSLETWVENEQWLDKLENSHDKLSEEYDVVNAGMCLTNLDMLLDQPCWRDYMPKDVPVFQHLRERLERVKAGTNG